MQTLQSNPTIREKLQLQDCECLQGFVNRNYTKLYDIVEIKSNALQEESFGNFTNHATYPELKQKFEVIRNIILSHRKQLQNLAQQQIDSKPQAYNLSDKTFYKKPTKQ
ncbi:hypothetical protein CQA44_10415 [Helicobacter sp. MIT 14-3879]|nr:hypothetical protein CQA44_10415 [Helicobacter sp. MIT 14-3879]